MREESRRSAGGRALPMKGGGGRSLREREPPFGGASRLFGGGSTESTADLLTLHNYADPFKPPNLRFVRDGIFLKEASPGSERSPKAFRGTCLESGIFGPLTDDR